MIRRLAAAILATVVLSACGGSEEPTTTQRQVPQTGSMKLTSTAFADGQPLPAEYTCDGVGRSPPLAWSDPPANTRSFALVVEDPDAPNRTFRHWGVYDIPAATHELAAGIAQDDPSGLRQTRNDFGLPGFGPACPPRGNPPHHYHFRLIALDVAQLPASPSDVKDLIDATHDHVLGSAELIGLYGRN